MFEDMDMPEESTDENESSAESLGRLAAEMLMTSTPGLPRDTDKEHPPTGEGVGESVFNNAMETMKAREIAADINKSFRAGDVQAIQKQLEALKGNSSLISKTFDALKAQLPKDVQCGITFQGGSKAYVQLSFMRDVKSNVPGDIRRQEVLITNEVAQATEIQYFEKGHEERCPLAPEKVLKSWNADDISSSVGAILRRVLKK